MSGCLGFNEGQLDRKPIPDLDPRDKAECAPGAVTGGALEIAANARYAFAECKAKHSNVVAQYEDVQEKFGLR